MSFALLIGFFVVWFWINGRALLYTADFLASDLGRQIYRGMSPRQTRSLALMFVIAGFAFLAWAGWELYHGTFQWRGSDRRYGFRDLLP